ncbi:MAG: hypothetical protein HC848_05615, partial [Limnobacter sp.]|nr:hypothetical protein [Limnobacter sp.]
MAVYSKCPLLLEYFKREDEESSFSAINFQGVMHFMKNLQPELNERRSEIMKTAIRLSTPGDSIGFPASMYTNDYNESPIQVVPNEDPQTGFVHLRLNARWALNVGDFFADHLAREPLNKPPTPRQRSKKQQISYFCTDFVSKTAPQP